MTHRVHENHQPASMEVALLVNLNLFKVDLGNRRCLRNSLHSEEFNSPEAQLGFTVKLKVEGTEDPPVLPVSLAGSKRHELLPSCTWLHMYEVGSMAILCRANIYNKSVIRKSVCVCIHSIQAVLIYVYIYINLSNKLLNI